MFTTPACWEDLLCAGQPDCGCLKSATYKGVSTHGTFICFVCRPFASPISGGKPIANDPLVQVDTTINTAKIVPDSGNPNVYNREKVGSYTCMATHFLPGYTYHWYCDGSMGIDAFNSTTGWFFESDANQTVNIASSTGSDAFPQSASVHCDVREADGTHSTSSNAITVNFHWPFEKLMTSGLPATMDNTEPLEDVEVSSLGDPKYPGYVPANNDVEYTIKGVKPTVAWFYDKGETFIDLAGLLNGDEAAIAFTAAKLTYPKKPADIVGKTSDSKEKLLDAAKTTLYDEHSVPPQPGDNRMEPPNFADGAQAAYDNPDPHVFEKYQQLFIHTVKAKHYFTIYHYKGDQYNASGFLGTLPTDIKEENGIPLAVNYYKMP